MQIIGFIEQLNEVDTNSVKPLSSVTGHDLPIRDDKVSDTASNIKKKVDAVTNPVGTLAKKAGNVAKKSTSAVSGAFGTSSFSKESKITFKQFIDKTP